MQAKKATGRNKSVVYFASFRSADLYGRLLDFVGIRNVVLSAKMKHAKRFEYIQEFNGDNDTIVFIATYSLKTEGPDLHYRCCTVILAEQATTMGQQSQSTHRIRRIGQAVEQEVRRYYNHQSYMRQIELNLWRKAKDLAHVITYDRTESGSGTALKVAVTSFGGSR